MKVTLAVIGGISIAISLFAALVVYMRSGGGYFDKPLAVLAVVTAVVSLILIFWASAI